MISGIQFKNELNLVIQNAIREDVGPGDFSSLACIPSTAKGSAKLLVKENGIIAGVAFAKMIFEYVDPTLQIEIFIEDGSLVQKGDVVFHVYGSSQSILKAERVVLNSMQRMSAIATKTKEYVRLLEGTKAKILDTRKTTPLIRHLEKWAVAIGGCHNYRHGLYDWFMIKDNHTDANGGSIAAAIQKIADYKRAHPEVADYGVTVEVRSLAELAAAMEAGKGIVTRIMLDNFTTALMKKAVKAVKTAGGDFQIEASGGVTMDNLRRIALTGVDYISSGALTHSVKSLDLSLKVVR